MPKNPIIKVLCSELFMFYYVFFTWKKKAPEGITLHKNSSYIAFMIMIIHAIESYFLNPKLYSITMKLPIFYTFIVLMVSELLFGAWGLVIGIPLFVFIIGLIKGDPFAKEVA